MPSYNLPNCKFCSAPAVIRLKTGLPKNGFVRKVFRCLECNKKWSEFFFA